MPNQMMRRPFVRPLPLLLPLALATLAGCAGVRGGASVGADSAAIRRDIAYLASDALEGRGTGTAGNDSAAAYIGRRYAALGLRPMSPGYDQPFVARSIALAHAGLPSELPTQNVVALLPGRDPALRGQYVVIGAHFDHLGRSAQGAQDPEAKDAIRNGADDNASGTAAVLELARMFSRHPARRSIIFVNFSGEELGVLGSRHFVDHAPVPLDSMVAMLNFDMVGRLKDDRLIVYGVGTATELPAILDSASAGMGFKLTAQGDGYGPSDHASFYEKGMPVLHFFTDLHEDYHRATDDADKINAGGEARVVNVAERIARAIADRPSRLTFVRQAAPQQTMSSREGTSAYLGSVPDMAASEVKGVRLSGVRPGSPADSAGLKAGDVIVEFGGRPIGDLYQYTDALYAHQPGEVVEIVVLRGGERVVVKARLGKR